MDSQKQKGCRVVFRFLSVSCRDPLLLGARLSGQEGEATAARDGENDASNQALDLRTEGDGMARTNGEGT